MPARIPSARTIARFMTNGRDKLSKAETVLIAAIESGLSQLVVAREIISDFHLMIRTKAVAAMTLWMERAADSLVASFGRGVRKDQAAVRAAITSPWSNGQTEGQITNLKLVKRKMYGRGKIDLLQARLIGAISESASDPNLHAETHLAAAPFLHCGREMRDGNRGFS